MKAKSKSSKSKTAASKKPALALPPRGKASDRELPFYFLNPFGGEIYKVGSRVAIYWQAAPSLTKKVSISLIDHTAWQGLFTIATTDPVSASPYGFYQWTIPKNFPFDPSREYRLYISDAQGTSYTYGPTFKIIP
jgi:hypothetical protein